MLVQKGFLNALKRPLFLSLLCLLVFTIRKEALYTVVQETHLFKSPNRLSVWFSYFSSAAEITNERARCAARMLTQRNQHTFLFITVELRDKVIVYLSRKIQFCAVFWLQIVLWKFSWELFTRILIESQIKFHRSQQNSAAAFFQTAEAAGTCSNKLTTEKKQVSRIPEILNWFWTDIIYIHFRRLAC